MFLIVPRFFPAIFQILVVFSIFLIIVIHSFQLSSCFVIILFISQRFSNIRSSPEQQQLTIFSTNIFPQHVSHHFPSIFHHFPPFSQHFPSIFPGFFPPLAAEISAPRHLQSLAAGHAQRERARRCAVPRAVFGISPGDVVGIFPEFPSDFTEFTWSWWGFSDGPLISAFWSFACFGLSWWGWVDGLWMTQGILGWFGVIESVLVFQTTAKFSWISPNFLWFDGIFSTRNLQVWLLFSAHGLSRYQLVGELTEDPVGPCFPGKGRSWKICGGCRWENQPRGEHLRTLSYFFFFIDCNGHFGWFSTGLAGFRTKS